MLPPLIAIFAFPVIVLISLRQTDLPRAILICIIAGYLLLPTNTAFNLPALPSLNKDTVPAFTALLLMGLSVAPGRAGLAGFLPRSILMRGLLAVLVLGTFMTVLTNGDRLFYGETVLPALRPYDGMSFVLQVILFTLPMLLARKYLASPESHRLFLKILCVAALAYSLLALVELRMSPQMNNWVYGFFPHSFAQHVRAGGYRPLVFLGHGLLLSLFFTFAILAAIGLFRGTEPDRTKYLFAAAWLLIMLILSKSLGALVIALLLGGVAFLLPSRVHLILAGTIGLLVLAYPIARNTSLIPLDRILDVAESYDPTRASSLRFRIDNEDRLLAKAEERPVFGWGGWGRSRIYSEQGTDVVIVDGFWIIALGVGGWTRYLSQTGLLVAPLFLLMLRGRRWDIGPETSVLALVLTANLVDMIPNSSNTPLTWLAAGALWGRLELGAMKTRSTAPSGHDSTSDDVPEQASPGYARKLTKPADMANPEPDATQSPEEADTEQNVHTRQRNRICRTRPSPGRR